MQHGGFLAFVPGVRIAALGLVPVLWLGCEDGQSVEDTVDAKPGIQQVGSADGPLLDEDEACEALHEALVDATDSNGCSDVSVPECPGLIRPGGSLACVRFSEESVDECVATIGAYGSCKDFVREACVVVAVVDETSAGCVPPAPPSLDAGADDAGLADDDDDVADDDVADDDVADDDVAGDDDSNEDAGADDDVPSDDDVADDDGTALADAGEMLDASRGLTDSGSGAAPSTDSGAFIVDSGSSNLDAGDASR
jgi:hypothetical protein